MEILVIALIAAGLVYLMYRTFYVKPTAPVKTEQVQAVGEPPATVVVEGGGVVSWHTAPPEGSALAANTLDVNHDGKVDLEDVKEVVKKVRGAKKPAAKKPAAKKPRKPKASS